MNDAARAPSRASKGPRCMAQGNPLPKIIATLAHLFPAFASEPWERHVPLKLGIHNDLFATGILTLTELSRALGSCCSRIMYLRACVVRAVRYDLNGKPA